MSNITAEQALQIPQQLKRQGSQHNFSEQPPSSSEEQSNTKTSILGEDLVTLLNSRPGVRANKVEVEQYKGELGQFSTFVKDTLKNKLAEYKINPNARVSVSKNNFGKLEVKGAVPNATLEKISQDLNNNQIFKDAFNRLKDQSPTLDYVDNVVKISKAYGVNNALFSTLLSSDIENNRLDDIAHRYESLRSQKPSESVSDGQDKITNFAFQIN